MAYIGLVKPYVGKWTADSTYSAPALLGKAIAMTIKSNYAESTLYADDGVAEYNKEFKDADITLGTDTIPISGHNTLFGHTVDTEKEGVTYNSGDAANYVGVGIIQKRVDSGVVSYQATFVYKAKFSDPDDDFETKGENIVYKTPSITGKAVADGTGAWKEKQKFETEALAVAWINTKFGVATTG